MDTTIPMRNVVAKFGGLRAMSRALGVPPSTIGSWVYRSGPPDWRIPSIVEAARLKGFNIDPASLKRPAHLEADLESPSA